MAIMIAAFRLYWICLFIGNIIILLLLVFNISADAVPKKSCVFQRGLLEDEKVHLPRS